MSFGAWLSKNLDTRGPLILESKLKLEKVGVKTFLREMEEPRARQGESWDLGGGRGRRRGAELGSRNF